jgi:thiosulfate/3-mercaptopyruvate sulfurtransferase
MLKWLGHQDVAVLDGGWPAWVREGRPTTAGVESREPRTFVPHDRPELVASVADVQRMCTDPGYRLIDSRTTDRYRGENETLDPVAGHIPGAVPGQFVDNLDASGRFLPPNELRARFESLFGEVPTDHAVFYCGSGVSAAHNVLAVAHAGLGEARLYPGSWSEWITDPKRPVATGPEPGGDGR